MPIKPEHKHRYPPDWPEIVARIHKRSGNRCELCGAPNGKKIRRDVKCGALYTVDHTTARACQASCCEDGKWIKVVLTVAHLDSTYQCHEDQCLLDLCQRCHLKIDAHIRHLARRNRSESKQNLTVGDMICTCGHPKTDHYIVGIGSQTEPDQERCDRCDCTQFIERSAR